MSLGAGEPASETGDDSLSAVTSGSDLETKTKRPSFHKPPPTSPKSPYHAKPGNVAPWRSRRTATSMPLSSRVSLTPQKLWLGTCKPGRVPGTPVYREKEDMYNEIIELKKSLHVQKSDVDLMRTKVRRLEEDNSRKDRQIEQLLDPTRGTDFVRTLADKRPDTGWVVTGLRQRILKLEQQCREKDNTISKLQTDMKTTNLEEMRIAMETYYEEVHRLQILLATSEAAGKKLPVERKTGLKRQQKMGGVLLNLSRSMQELTEENQSLKEDLDRLLSGSPPVSKIKGYMEWSKPRLLRHITELEKKISSLESPKSHALELVKPGSRPPSSRCTAHRQPPADLQEGPERLRAALKGFRGEQAALYTQLQEKDLEVKQLLQTKADLERELEQVKGSEKEGREREEALREQVETLTRKLQELHERQRDKEEALVGMAQEPQEDLQLPVPSSSCSPEASEADCSAASSRPPSAHSAGSGEEGQRDTAARVLQAQWRARQHKKKEAALDEEATVLQAAFRGHRARAQLLASRACGSPSPSTPSPPRKCPATPRSQSPTAPDGTGLEEAILLVQSVFRAHLARTRPGAISERTTTTAPARRTSASTANRDASSPPALVASAQDDSEASSVESMEGSVAEEEALTPGDPAIAEPTLSRSQAAVPPPTEEAPSDDSDDIISPSLPRKKSSSP